MGLLSWIKGDKHIISDEILDQGFEESPCDDRFTAQCAIDIYQTRLVQIDEAIDLIKVESNKGGNNITFYKERCRYSTSFHGRLISDECIVELRDRGFKVKSARESFQYDEISWF